MSQSTMLIVALLEFCVKFQPFEIG